MSLSPLTGADALRIETAQDTPSIIGYIYVIDGDIVEITSSEVNMTPIVPVFGDSYFILNNSSISKNVSTSIKFTAPFATFSGLDNHLNNTPGTRVKIVYGGFTLTKVQLLKGFLTGVYFAYDLTNAGSVITGSITLMQTS